MLYVGLLVNFLVVTVKLCNFRQISAKVGIPVSQLLMPDVVKDEPLAE